VSRSDRGRPDAGDGSGSDRDSEPESSDSGGDPAFGGSDSGGGSGLYGSGASPDDQRAAFLDGDVPTAVYGLGKMGLPLAAVYADVAGNVTGVDVDPAVVEAVNGGESHVGREPGLDELVARTVDSGALRATTDARAAAAAASIHVVVVPVGLTAARAADLSALKAVGEAVAAGLDSGDLVVVESTVPPRTCRDTLGPLLAEGSGLGGDDSGENGSRRQFGLAFCPERTSSGRAIEDIRGAYPKIVGGIDAESTRAATLVYEEINSAGVLAVADATTAEAVKVFEGVYRDANIALANELARFSDALEIDVRGAIAAANTQPYCDIHDPGIGVGGHCIPYYPHFLIDGFGVDAPLMETARAVNDSMPTVAVAKLREEFAAEGRELDGARALVLGLTYRPGVEETAATPARGVVEELNGAGAAVLAADPLLAPAEIAAFDTEPVGIGDLPGCDLDAAVLVTAHEEFEAIEWGTLGPGGDADGNEDADADAGGGGLIVVDGRGVLDLSETDHRLYTIGIGRRGR
jgi:UDP-N-acetyl-D-mannosaminuronic acid dehydrogenase